MSLIYFQFSGRRPITTIISQKPSVLLKFSVLPLKDKLDLVHQMTENSTVTDQSNTDYSRFESKFRYNFLWKSKLYQSTARIVVPVFYKLRIRMNPNNTIYIHDGPGTFSKRMRLHIPLLLLSSNQAFCILYSLKDMGNTTHFDQVGLRYDAEYADVIHVHVSGNEPVRLPPCVAESAKTSQQKESHLKNRKTHLKLSSIYEADPKDRNLLCVYNLTSTSGYINLSITEMTVRGFDWDSGFYRCFLGGAAFRSVLHRRFGRLKKQHHTRYLCHNYTSKYNMTGIYDKSMMDIVSHTKEGLIFAVYSYKHYSEVNIKATVGTTPCMGNLNYKFTGKN